MVALPIMVIENGKAGMQAGHYTEIGQRLKAYRLGANLSPDLVAEKLGVSRAALYRIEAGHVVKIETLERLAHVLNTSVGSLLGIGVEYYAQAAGFFERMRQLEAESDKIVAHFGPFSYLLMSADYTEHLREMLIEGLPHQAQGKVQLRKDIEHCLKILEQRRGEQAQCKPNIVNIVSLSELQRFLSLGLVGRLDLPLKMRNERVARARHELKRLADLMENEPMGVQIGVVEEMLPGVSFQVFQSGRITKLAVSPFRLGELPNIRGGIAMVTDAPDAVGYYTKLADDLWQSAEKGARGAVLVRKCLKKSGPD